MKFTLHPNIEFQSIFTFMLLVKIGVSRITEKTFAFMKI